MMNAITGVDHAIVNVRDNMDAVAAQYQRLGFQLTPRGFHSLGTLNHLAIFEHDYLELLGYTPGKPPGGLGPMVDGAPGLVGCALASDNAEAVYQQASSQGIAVETPLHFSRPVDLPQGSQEAAFSITRFPSGTAPGLEVFVCQHHTPELVWREEWMTHPNGALGIDAISVVVAEPDQAVAEYQRLLGGGQVIAIAGGLRMVLGTVTLELIRAAALTQRIASLPKTMPAPTAMLSLRVSDPNATADYFQAQGVIFDWWDDTVLVSPQDSGGTLLAFSP